jgi:UDP-N-acetylmuramyl tripeptide synthase
VTARATRVARMGAGTSLPGLVAERVHPHVARDLARSLTGGIALVTGTNGKTTTSAMLVAMLERAGRAPVCNASGSNLHRGVTAALVLAAHGRRAGVRAGVFEVDENAIPAVAGDVKPKVIAVTNVLRDQLDRFGETDSVLGSVRRAIEKRPEAVLVLNADDPGVAHLADGLSNPVVYYAVACDGPGALMSVAETASCPVCGDEVGYRHRSYAHLGEWACCSCHAARPEPVVLGSAVEISPSGCRFRLAVPGWSGLVELPQPGLHNVYNAVAAIASAVAMGVEPAVAVAALSQLGPVFGRTETLDIEGRSVVLLLAKNPVGLALAMSAVAAKGASGPIGFALNDNTADGHDISWIWDAGLEGFDLAGREIVTSGTRAADMALRLKYAGVSASSIEVIPELSDAVRNIARRAHPGGTAYLVSTYTAMVEIRDGFASSGDRFALLGRLMKRGL